MIALMAFGYWVWDLVTVYCLLQQSRRHERTLFLFMFTARQWTLGDIGDGEDVMERHDTQSYSFSGNWTNIVA
jgi:hypothetical protein